MGVFTSKTWKHVSGGVSLQSPFPTWSILTSALTLSPGDTLLRTMVSLEVTVVGDAGVPPAYLGDYASVSLYAGLLLANPAGLPVQANSLPGGESSYPSKPWIGNWQMVPEPVVLSPDKLTSLARWHLPEDQSNLETERIVHTPYTSMALILEIFDHAAVIPNGGFVTTYRVAHQESIRVLSGQH